MFGLGKQNGPETANGHQGSGKVHLIDLHQVVKTFETPAGKFTALRGVDLHIDEGEFVSIVGKSGSGKSTLINMITGIDRPTSGEVWVGGADVRHLNEGQMAVWRGRTVGVVFQFFQLLPTLTAIENVTLPMDFVRSGSLAEKRQRAMHLLELVGMADQAHELPLALSGGQQQSVAIARALANDPPIVAADEPTGKPGLENRRCCLSIVRTISRARQNNSGRDPRQRSRQAGQAHHHACRWRGY